MVAAKGVAFFLTPQKIDIEQKIYKYEKNSYDMEPGVADDGCLQCVGTGVL